MIAPVAASPGLTILMNPHLPHPRGDWTNRSPLRFITRSDDFKRASFRNRIAFLRLCPVENLFRRLCSVEIIQNNLTLRGASPPPLEQPPIAITTYYLQPETNYRNAPRPPTGLVAEEGYRITRERFSHENSHDVCGYRLTERKFS
jgi:hypothetical protein